MQPDAYKFPQHRTSAWFALVSSGQRCVCGHWDQTAMGYGLRGFQRPGRLLIISVLLMPVSLILQELVRAHSGAEMTCIMWKKQKDELAEFRLAFQRIHTSLGSDPSMKEIPSFQTKHSIQHLGRYCPSLSWTMWTLLVCSYHFKTRLLSCAFLGAVLSSI